MNASDTKLQTDIIRYSIYVIEGSILSSTNLLIVFTVLRHYALRNLKEYLLISSLCFVDGLNGLADIIAGVYRLNLILTGRQNESVSVLSCFLVPCNLIWAFTFVVQGPMLCILSIDRLNAVVDPLAYIGYSRNYILKLSGSVYACGMLFYIAVVHSMYQIKDKLVGIFCFSGWVMSPGIYNVMLGSRSWGGLLSIALYLCVLFVHYKKAVHPDQPNSGLSGPAAQADLKRTKKFTKSIGISCIMSFLFFALPTGATILAFIIDPIGLYSTVGVWSYIISSINPICNGIIFLKRHKDLRNGAKALVTCNSLPNNIGLWNQG